MLDKTTNAAARLAEERNKSVTFKKYVSFTDCIGETNNAEVDNAKDSDGVMQIHYLIAYRRGDNYAKTSGSLWQYHKEFSMIT